LIAKVHKRVPGFLVSFIFMCDKHVCADLRSNLKALWHALRSLIETRQRWGVQSVDIEYGPLAKKADRHFYEN
jgi:hypothetical protein